MKALTMVNARKKIKKLLIDKDTSGSEIAREYGRTRWAFYQVVAGRSKSPEFREFIAAKLGTRPERLWPREN